MDERLPATDSNFGVCVSEDHQRLINAEFEPQERLLWAGRAKPRQNPLGCGFYFFTALSLILGSISASLYRSAYKVGGMSTIDGVDRITGGSFAIVLTLLFTAVVFAIWRHNRSINTRKSSALYAISDRRILFWIPEIVDEKLRVISVAAKKINNVHRSEATDGSGDIIFALHDTAYPRDDYESGFWFYSKFIGIPEVHRVERIVRANLLNDCLPPDA